MSLIFTPLEEGKYVARASLVLRTLEGTDLQTLDILVRESIQNSLDAFADSNGSVAVDFSVHDRPLNDVSGIFDETTKQRLDKEFQDTGTSKILAIKDTGTTGLSGDFDDTNSKIYKLVGDIGRAQENEGSGGSWGLGKTCYYHMGRNIVGFYSRSHDAHGKKTSRLCFGYIENEKNENRLITETPTGIAWWGGENGAPIRNHKAIESILRKLGVTPFEQDETGTCIIIPFFRQTQDSDTLTGEQPLYWEENDVDYIEVAIQRWYMNRLIPNVGKSKLIASVNGNPLRDLLPPFSALQDLKRIIDNFKRHKVTDTTEGLKLMKDNSESLGWKRDERENTRPRAYIKSINLQKTRDAHTGNSAPAGWLAALHISEEDLDMLPPENLPSPHKYIFGSYEERDELLPIVAMSRGPKMIVAYNTDAWRRGLRLDAPGEYLIALFMLNSEARLPCGTSLEEYIRGIENPTHSDWKDSKTGSEYKRVPTNIQNGVVSALRNVFFDDNLLSENEPGAAFIRARLGETLLPPDFGNMGTSAPPVTPEVGEGDDKVPPPPPPPPPRHPQPTMTIYNVEYDHKGIRLFLTISNGHSKALEISIDADAGAGQTISKGKWEKEIKSPGFPFIVTELAVTGIKKVTKKGAPKDFREPKPGEVETDTENPNQRIAFRDSGSFHITAEVFVNASDKSINPVVRLISAN